MNLAAMLLMLPNLEIDLKTNCKWWKIQEVAFRTNGREKWNPESGDDSWLLSSKSYFEFIQTLELEKCIENMLITFPFVNSTNSCYVPCYFVYNFQDDCG